MGRKKLRKNKAKAKAKKISDIDKQLPGPIPPGLENPDVIVGQPIIKE